MEKSGKPQMNIMSLDYKSRGMDICQFCGMKYNVGERIPRILVHCGHTLCTSCLSELHHQDRIRCPICRKLIKNLDSPERLPLNINILFEIVEKDKTLKNLNFDFDCEWNTEDPDEMMKEKFCPEHPDRVMHFYDSYDKTVFCRECIKLYHSGEESFVVDLYEI